MRLLRRIMYLFWFKKKQWSICMTTQCKQIYSFNYCFFTFLCIDLSCVDMVSSLWVYNNWTKYNLFFCNLYIVPPRILSHVSPSSVTCEKYTLCCLFCYATSDSPVTYSWTKNGHDPINDDIKVVNDNIVITPRTDMINYMCYRQEWGNCIIANTYNVTDLMTNTMYCKMCYWLCRADFFKKYVVRKHVSLS